MQPAATSRRDLIRLALASAAVAGAGGLLTGCDGSSSGLPAPSSGSGSGDDAIGGLRQVSARLDRAQGAPALVGDVVAGLQRFAGRLHAEVAAGVGPAGNVVLSPLSVLVALGMTMAGAEGETRAQISRALGADGVPGGVVRWHSGLNALRRHLEGLAGRQQVVDGEDAEIVLRSADRVVAQRGVAWGRPFLETLARDYGAGLLETDIAGAPDEARRRINDWVAQQTDRRITDLLPEGSVRPDTRLVLVDALRLVAAWLTPFAPELTQPGTFLREDGGPVQVPMMRATGLAARLHDDGRWRALTLPYVGERLAMTLVLPGADPRLDLAGIESLLADGRLGELLGGGDVVAVDLALPRWTTRTGVALKPALAALGIERAFADDAQFAPMTAGERPPLALAIDEVVHQGFVAVDEAGTEAAAAAAVLMREVSAPAESASFVVDRPFLFVVHDVEHRAPLFVGRVGDPSA